MKIRRFTWFLSLLFLMPLASCQTELPFEDEHTRLEIEQLLTQQHYAEARSLLEHAVSKTSKSYRVQMAINRAIIDMEEGHYEIASKALSELLSDPQVSSEALSWIHYFKGICDLELYKRLEIDSVAPMFEALEHLYIADSQGIACRSQIGKSLQDNVMRCDAFQSETDRLASSPSMAIRFQDQIKATVCPHQSVWLRFETRPYEFIHPSVVFNALDRILWPDESSQLPYSNSRIRIYASDEQNRPLDTPILDYELPLATTEPSADAYVRTQPLLEAFTADPKSSPYYIELSTKRNGEASVELTLKRDVDCQLLDDRFTWTNNFNPIHFEPQPGILYSNLLLCPSRPDTLSFQLMAGESLMFLLHPTTDTVFNWKLSKDGKPIATGKYTTDPIPHTQPDTHIRNIAQTLYHIHTPRETNPRYAKTETPPVPLVALLANTGDASAVYDLTLSLAPHQTLQYHFQYIKSSACGILSDQSVVKHEIQLPVSNDFSKSPEFFYAIGWSCAGETHEFTPLFNHKNLTGRYDIFLTSFYHFSDPNITFSLESVLRANDGTVSQDLIAEQGEYTPNGRWFNTDCQKTQSLKRPITSQSVLKYTGDASNFWILYFYPQENLDELSEDKEKQNEDENEKQDTQNGDPEEQPKKEDHPSDSGDNENASPQEKTDTQASPEGPGEDTHGNKSNPDESRNDNPQSSAQSLESYERRRLDEALDGQESGVVEIPSSGIINREETEDDMPW